MEDLTTQIKIGADASGVEAGVTKAKRSLSSLGETAKTVTKTAGDSLSKVGDGGDKAAKKVESATKSMQNQIQRLIASFEGGERGSRKFFESLARQRGVDANALRPLLNQLDAVRSSSEAAGGSMSSFGAAAGLAGRAFALLGIAGGVRSLVAMADASTNVASRLGLVTASASELISVQQQLFSIAQESRVGFVDLSFTYAQVARSTRELGVSQSDLLGVVRTISQAVTISGGSAASAQAALVQLSQGFASGALRGQELNSVLEQTPRLAEAIASGLGVSIGKLREMGTDGELTAGKVLNALKNSASAVESEFERMAVTVGTASTKASNSVLRFVGVIDKITGASAGMASGLSDASSNLDILSRDIERLASSRGLSDFFFLALNNEKTLNTELGITQQQLVEVEARLARSPSNIYARQAAQDMRAYVAEIKEAQVRLAQLSGQSGPRDGRDQSGFTSRGQGYAAEAARQAKLAEDLNAFKLKQSGVSPGYIKDVQEIIRLNKEGVLVGKDYVDALAKQQKALLDKGGANASASKAERAATKSMRDQSQLLAELSGLTTSFAADWDLLSKAYATGKVSLDGLTQAQAVLLAKQPFAVALAKEEAEAVKLIAKARESDAKAYADTVIEAQKAVGTVADRIVALEQEAQVSEMVRTQKISEAEAIELLSIARLREKATIIELFDPQAAELAHLKEEIAQREKLVGLLGQKRERKDITDAAENAAKAWEKTADSIESTLTDALMRGFESGKGFGESLGDSIVNMFKTYVAKEIAAAISKALLSSMSGQGGWLSALGSIFGGATGGGGGIDYGRLANAAYKYYTGTGAGAGAGAGTISNGMTQSQMLASQEAGMGTGAGGASSGSAAGTYMTYAAFIYAFAKIGSNLYNKGYTRAALGYGNGDQEFRPSGVGTTGAGSNRNAVYEASAENFNRKLLDSMGLFSEKWRDLLSGSTRMATLFGRKLKAFGLEATINGLDTDVKAFERYKGGLFRSNKTIKTEATEREVDALRKSVDGVRESSKAMARAMGYSDDAIDSFTGSVRVNFKNAKTGEEAAKRYAEAMEDLQRQMINTATGIDMSKEEFKEFMTGIQESIQAAGITTQGIGDIILGGMMGRLSEQEVGDQLADVIIGGIYNSIAGNYAAQIAEMFSAQIITPIFTAIAAGVPISQAISQTAIANIVKTAQDAATALNAIFSNAEFQQAIGQIGQAISGVSKAVTKVRVPSFGSARTNTANAVASERYGLETQLLNLLGNTDRLRQRELASLHAGNRALQVRIWALEDSKSAVDAAMSALERSVEAQRKTVQEQLDAALESEDMLNDVFDTLRENIRELRGDVSSTANISAAEGREKILQAISGAITLSNDDLADAIGSVRDSLDNQAFASKFERDRAALVFAGELDALAGITEDSLSAAEQTVTLLEEQLTSLDSTLELAQKQIDALYGVDTSVKTVADSVLALNVAMSGYAAAIAAAQTVATSGGATPVGGGSSGGGGGSSGGGGGGKTWTAAGYWNKNPDLHKEYRHLIEIDPKQTDPRFTKSASLSYRDEYLAWHWANYGQKEKRRYAAGGYYPGGLALVGEEGPEIINFKRPGQVYTARQTADLMRGEGAMTGVVKELQDMRKDQHDQALAVLLMQQKLNKIVSRWDSNGIPETRVLS